MTDDFKIPDYRPLPDAVRRRLRQRIADATGQRSRRRPGWPSAVLVAASVTALTVTVVAVNGTDVTTSTPPSSTATGPAGTAPSALSATEPTAPESTASESPAAESAAAEPTAGERGTGDAAEAEPLATGPTAEASATAEGSPVESVPVESAPMESVESSAPTPPITGEAGLQRCRQAVQHSDKAADYPDPAGWQLHPLAAGQKPGPPASSAILPLLAGDTIVFCGLTPTTVRLSAPVTDAGTAVTAQLAIPNGPVAGFTGGRDQLDFTWVQGNSWGDSTTVVKDGVFVTHVSFSPKGVLVPEKMTTKGPPARSKGIAVPAAHLEVVDFPHPGEDAERRTALTQCLADTPDQLSADSDELTPMAVSRTGNRLAVAAVTSQGTMIVCGGGAAEPFSNVPGGGSEPEPNTDPVRLGAYLWNGGRFTDASKEEIASDITVGGFVDPSVATLTFSDGHQTIEASLYEGTFVVRFTARLTVKDFEEQTGTVAPVRAKAYDAAGELIFDGPVVRG